LEASLPIGFVGATIAENADVEGFGEILFDLVEVSGDGVGAYEPDWQRRLQKDKHAYACWGETSDNKRMTVETADAAESAGMIVTRSEMADTGHKFIPEEKEKVKSWLLETVLPARTSPEKP
ncbi:MAG: hypothetical protein AAGD22_09670, partial [Verrucomicrobiota bacterium]